MVTDKVIVDFTLYFVSQLYFLLNCSLDRAKDSKSPVEKIVALKKVRMENEKEGLPMSALREISLLLKCDHENIVRLQEVLVGRSLDR